MKKTLILAAVLMLAACGNDHPQQTQAAPAGGTAPVVVQQDSGMTSLLMGAGLGYLLGSSGNRQQTQIVQQAPAVAPAPRRDYFTPSAPAVTPKIGSAVPPKPVAVTPPKAAEVKAPTPAPASPVTSFKPSYNPPKIVSAPAPSRSFSSPSYSAPSRSYSAPSYSSGRR